MTDISQAEAENLLKMPKQCKEDKEYQLPNEKGGRLTIKLESLDHREIFFLDISRGRANLEKPTPFEKGTYQNRARQSIILVRLDFYGAPHTNPDGQEIGVPHLHLYREGYDDKWAFPVPAGYFPNLHDRFMLLKDFMNYCSIIKQPNFSRDLFS